MARGATLSKILNEVRIEARISRSSAHNVQDRDRQVGLIQREQERLWEDYDWPHLKVERFMPVQAGQRFYDPDAFLKEDGTAPRDLSFARIMKAEYKSDGTWLPLSYGIDAGHYNAHDSALDERSSPARAWRLYEGEQIEIWPVPDVTASTEQEGYVRFTGIRDLRPLVNDSDTADLDDKMLALYVAAILLKDDAQKSQALDAANRRYNVLKGNPKKTTIGLCDV